jgi:mannose-6-phosphate isomerase
MKSPITFKPNAMEGVWGGLAFESLPGKELPAGVPVGELWEVVDREDAQSVVDSGPCKGDSLHCLWRERREEVFGAAYLASSAPRFPLLVKLLDARDTLSVQVHPPASKAAALGGEPKTEVWYFLESHPGALVYAGLKKGVTRAGFEERLAMGGVEETLHSIPVRTGESIFIPSGRLHAIGGGNLIVEIQQNSDTTYRVYDWGRVGLDGAPRALHVGESMESIDFDDFEPGVSGVDSPLVADCPLFRVEKRKVGSGEDIRPAGRFALCVSVDRAVYCGGKEFQKGGFFLVPASGQGLEVGAADGEATILVCTLPV